MGAEVGATTSIFAYDDSMERYLISTDRQDVVEAASIIKHLHMVFTGPLHTSQSKVMAISWVCHPSHRI